MPVANCTDEKVGVEVSTPGLTPEPGSKPKGVLRESKERVGELFAALRSSFQIQTLVTSGSVMLFQLMGPVEDSGTDRGAGDRESYWRVIVLKVLDPYRQGIWEHPEPRTFRKNRVKFSHVDAAGAWGDHPFVVVEIDERTCRADHFGREGSLLFSSWPEVPEDGPIHRVELHPNPDPKLPPYKVVVA